MNIGIDKVVIYDLKVTKMDLQFLLTSCRQYGLVEMTGMDGSLNKRIRIRDNSLFVELSIGDKPYSNGDAYVHLTLTPTNYHGFNSENLSWYDYDEFITFVIAYIEYAYRIRLSTEKAKLRSIEINCNIPLKGPYADYNRAIRLLMSLLPKHLKVAHTAQGTKQGAGASPTYLSSNGSMAIAVYNKTAQMVAKHKGSLPGLVNAQSEHIPNPPENVPELEDADDVSSTENACSPDTMRIEIRLLTPKKIKAVFGSNLWTDLNDEKISAYFRRTIHKEMQEKYEQWQTERQRDLILLVDQMRKAHTNGWHHHTMQHIRNMSERDGVPYILDVEQVIDALKALPDPNRNHNRAIKALLGIKVQDDLYRKNDRKKVLEILDALDLSH